MSESKKIEPLGLRFGEAVKLVSQGGSPRQPPQATRTMETDGRNFMMQEKQERVMESDLALPALRLISESKEGFISTTDLIQELQKLFNPTGKDDEIIDGRADTYFSQKVRNLVSHRDSGNNIISRGYAEHDSERAGLRITDKGSKLLASLSG